ncbi:hypothetical protein [Methylobacterium sp. SD21]|uniref:hypothetical protein n=1 Tax=Methylobacterium litchii TaxID=3138810 RepID=UPI00313DFBD3
MNTSPAFITYGAFQKWMYNDNAMEGLSEITRWLPPDFASNLTGVGTNKVKGTLNGAKVEVARSNLVRFKPSKPGAVSPKEYKRLVLRLQHPQFSLVLAFQAKASDIRPWLTLESDCTHDFTGDSTAFLNWLTQVKLMGHPMFDWVDQGVMAGAAVYASRHP